MLKLIEIDLFQMLQIRETLYIHFFLGRSYHLNFSYLPRHAAHESVWWRGIIWHHVAPIQQLYSRVAETLLGELPKKQIWRRAGAGWQ